MFGIISRFKSCSPKPNLVRISCGESCIYSFRPVLFLLSTSAQKQALPHVQAIPHVVGGEDVPVLRGAQALPQRRLASGQAARISPAKVATGRWCSSKLPLP